MMNLKRHRSLRKAVLFGGLLALAVPSIAGPNLPAFGTKADIGAAPTQAPGVGFMPFLQMMMALGIVLVLVKFALPKLMGGLNKKIVAKSGNGIHIEETASLGSANLYVVSIREKTFLLGSTQNTVSCLAELPSKRAAAEPDLFIDLLERETEAPSHNYVDQAGEPTPAMKSALTDDEIQAALARLNKLGG